MARKLWPNAIAVIAGVGLVGGAGLEVARAHIDPAPLLLEKAARARAGLDYETLVVEGRLIEAGQPPAPIWEGVWSNRAHRREVRRGDDIDATLTIGRKRWKVGASQTDATREPSRILPDPIQAFVVDADGESGRRMALLEAYSIDASLVSMARQAGRPCYVIGAKPWEPEKPQLWLDAELLTPSRLVFTAAGAKHDLRWIGFDGPLTGPFYPTRYEERRDGELILTIEYTRAEPNAPIDDRRFTAPRP